MMSVDGVCSAMHLVHERADVAADLPAVMLPVLLPCSWESPGALASLDTTCGGKSPGGDVGVSIRLLEALLEELDGQSELGVVDSDASADEWGVTVMRGAKSVAKTLDKARRAAAKDNKEAELGYQGWPARVKAPMAMLPVRWCLTGSDSGAPLGDLLNAVGRRSSLARIKAGLFALRQY